MKTNPFTTEVAQTVDPDFAARMHTLYREVEHMGNVAMATAPQGYADDAVAVFANVIVALTGGDARPMSVTEVVTFCMYAAASFQEALRAEAAIAATPAEAMALTLRAAQYKLALDPMSTIFSLVAGLAQQHEEYLRGQEV